MFATKKVSERNEIVSFQLLDVRKAIGKKLDGESDISQPRTWKQQAYVRLWRYPDQGLKLPKILCNRSATASYLPIPCVKRFSFRSILFNFYRRRIRGKFSPFLLKFNIVHHLIKDFLAVTDYPRFHQGWSNW